MSDDSNDPILSSPNTINPYKLSIKIFWQRLRWDLKREAWRSRRFLGEWHDKYIGQKAVILCNGPSLLATDFDLLDGVFTFGLNKINLLFDKSSFRPSCIVAINPFVIEQNASFFNMTQIPAFIDSYGMKWVRPRSNIGFIHSTSGVGFARDCSLSIYQGHTVTYVAMQLAYHMGFTEVSLVGCDHSFAVDGPANATVVAGEKDDSHFDPNYFSGGVKWQLPDLFESEAAYTRAKQVYEAHGRKLINSTHGGKLDIFERRSLAEFLAL